MSHPINDIFEGTADLLLEHGIPLHSHYTLEMDMVDTYISYGGFTYKLRYVDGKLNGIGIFRLPRKEEDNGQD